MGKKNKRKTVGLKRQLVVAFASVSILPLMVLVLFMIGSNLLLTFRLYEQNIHNSTALQGGLIEENMNQLMVRAGRFASSRAVRKACSGTFDLETDEKDMSRDILSFTDETIDSVAAFSLFDKAGTMLYSSGSNDDIEWFLDNLAGVEVREEQYICEISFEKGDGSLLIVTPVKDGEELVGSFFIICETDYFLKMISGTKQIQSSNALIYCMEHRRNVTSKLGFEGELPRLDKMLKTSEEGSLICMVGGVPSLIHYKQISKIPWVLVTTVSISRIFQMLWKFVVLAVLLLILASAAVIFFSRRKSRKIVQPIRELLEAVEEFFLSDTAHFPKLELDPGTEIGYLAGKFVHMSEEIAEAQGKIRESNYLYTTLLQATYELRVIIDLKTDTIESSSDFLSQRLRDREGPASGRMFSYFTEYAPESAQNDTEMLREIVYGERKEPSEIEICCQMREDGKDSWYRIIAVTIEEAGRAERVVLHFEDITSQKHREQRLLHSSRKDPLCGLLNKAAFRSSCTLSEPGKTDAVFFFDLDHFKQLNDTLGHKAGDELLIESGRIIKAHFRSTDAIARFGGDEFVVFAPDMTKEQVEKKGRELVESLIFHREAPSETIEVTASVGACLIGDSMTLEEGMECADQAMYDAKKSGRSQFCLFAENR